MLDPLGRRIGKKVDGALERRWLYRDLLAPLGELGPTGALLSRFVYGRHGNVPDYLVRGSVAYKIITDHVGSVRLVVNAATGEVAQRIDYDELGRVLLDTSPGFQPFGFAGGLYDADTGLFASVRGEYTQDCRWTTQDPSLFVGATNL